MHHTGDNLDDAALVALVLGGAREAFAPLLLRHYQGVLRLCRRLLRSEAEAQDMTQEAALRSFLDLRRLEDPARFGAWLHAIAANLARMALRRRRTLSLDALDGLAPLVLWPQPAPSPEEVQAARETHDAIVAALGELSPANRDVAIGFFLEGYSYAELAELLGVPVGTIKGRLFKGRRQLQRRLAPVASDTLKPDRRQRKERVLVSTNDTPELVKVTVDSIRVSLLANHRVVVLREEAGDGRHLPIWIGPFEADAIKRALEGEQSERPMTHDMALRLLEPLGAQVTRVVVNKIVESTFFAEITLAVGDQIVAVDARPSDALALAVRTGVPIYTARSVLDLAGIKPSDPDYKEADTSQPPSRFFGLTWRYVSEMASTEKGPALYEQMAALDWAERFPTRELELDGQTMLAARLSDGDEAAWLLVRPALWEEIRLTGQRMVEQAQRLREAMGKACTAEPPPAEPPPAAE